MICYMPFSYIEDRIIQKLTAALGRVTLFVPASEMVPVHMRKWAQKGFLDLRHPQGVEADHLAPAIGEFKAWADLHQGNIADMAAFFRFRAGCPPMVDETDPTRIGDQIRHYGKQALREPVVPHFQSALFLAMAQEYDQQHDAAARQMETVLAMEKAMLARLSGDGDAMKTDFSSPDESANQSMGMFDAGGYMTEKRVKAWAELADRDNQPFLLYATTSSAVFEYLLALFPKAQGPWSWNLHGAENGTGDSMRQATQSLKALSLEKDPAAFSLDLGQEPHAGTVVARLLLYVLSGVSPRVFPARLLGGGGQAEPWVSSNQSPVNTLIGLIDPLPKQ